MEPIPNRRLLVVEDQQDVQEDFVRVLQRRDEAMALGQESVEMYGRQRQQMVRFEVDFTCTGAEALDKVRLSVKEGRPYAVVFVAVGIPPWGGLETASRLWEEDAFLQVVICGAREGAALEEARKRARIQANMCFLNKPFDTLELVQLAYALTNKWMVAWRSRKKLDELARLLERQTREMTATRDQISALQSQMHVASNAVDVINQSKSRLLNDMGFAIRTPLTSILGFADMMDQFADGKNMSQADRLALDSIRRNSEFLKRVAEDISNLTELSKKTGDMDRRPCSLIRVLQSVFSLMRVHAEAKGLAFEIHFQTDIPRLIFTDELRLEKILVNLIGNAIKFTPKGSVSLDVALVEEKQSAWVRFDIKDSGVGMGSAQIQEFEQAFQRFQLSGGAETPGSRLGLLSSKVLAINLGGDLEVKSVEGKGTTVVVRISAGDISRIKRLRHPEAALQSLLALNKEDDADRLDCRVLLAEDTVDNQYLISTILRNAGAEVTAVNNGEFAVEKALSAQREGRPYDVILMDMMMPVLDGFRATQELRRSGYEGPIIAVSAMVALDNQKRCREAGCDAFIAKPIDLQQLIRCVKDQLRTSREGRRLSSLSEGSSSQRESSQPSASSEEVKETVLSLDSVDHKPLSRILIIDDNEEIHRDFMRILRPEERPDPSLIELENIFFDQKREKPPEEMVFEVFSAFQGQEGVEYVRNARRENKPFSVVFVDMRMPPGWDGVETIERLWREDPDLQAVICTAYSDYSWEDIVERLGRTDRLLILKKPFDLIEVRQLACALCAKWDLIQELQKRMRDLYAARHKAEEANRAKSEFLANMSHELRTPLHGILSFAGFGIERFHRASPEKLLDYFHKIKQSGEILLYLLNDLLDLSKLESGKMEFYFQSVNIRTVIKGIVEGFGSLAEKKGITIKTCFLSEKESLVADRTKMEQVLRNLLSNALKFSPQEGVVEVRVEDAPEAMRISVSDEGVGIPEDEVHLVFEEFVQSSKTKTGAGGTGLGLAMCRKIVQAHQGRIWAENRPKGAVFSLEIPLNLECHESEAVLNG